MSEEPRAGEHALARQVVQYLESLKAAGIEWLPAAPPLPRRVAASPAPAAQATPPAPARSLFPEAGGNVAAPSAADSQEPGTLEQRRQELKVLAEAVAGCRRCPELVVCRKQTVFGVGEPGVELCFVGEAPGADEDAQGEPFVGAAGQLLNRIITACKMKREEVYICNIVKCRPPGNRTPTALEAANCRSFLERQLDLVRPKFICALGGCAATNLLGASLSIARLRGRLHDYRGIPVLVTYHPAFLLPHRAPDPKVLAERKREVWKDMKLLMARMGRPVE